MLPKMLNESSLQKCSHMCFLKCFWTLTPFLFLEGKKHLLWNYVVDSVAPWQPTSLLYSIINSREWLHSILVRTQTHCNNTVCFGFASPLANSRVENVLLQWRVASLLMKQAWDTQVMWDSALLGSILLQWVWVLTILFKSDDCSLIPTSNSQCQSKLKTFNILIIFIIKWPIILINDQPTPTIIIIIKFKI